MSLFTLVVVGPAPGQHKQRCETKTFDDLEVALLRWLFESDRLARHAYNTRYQKPEAAPGTLSVILFSPAWTTIASWSATADKGVRFP